ncbi:putative Gustatory receptor [Daphnia magna]|uniref:Putative Gustatory receptor n=1 Tax=Daphnia magna TaxID=35525 RepID=A0A164VNM4_9CRUS|nr:putative Gustatory receptor [Daphnia magna]
MCRSKSTVTLRALIPYLIIYRALGLLPMKFTKKSNSKLFNFQQFCELSWWRSLNFTRIYSGCVVLLATAFLFDNLPSLESQNSSDIVGRLLEIADRSSICLNVFITSVICFCYLGKRLSILVTKMIECEQQLATIDCYLQDRLAVYCWIVLAIGGAATVLNELAVNLKYICYPSNSTVNVEDHSIPLVIFRWTMTPFAAGFMPFVDFSVIHLSLIFAAYQEQLRRKIERWALLELEAKESLRLTYWKVQALISEADDIFSPIILIGSLSIVAHLTLQINILTGSRVESTSGFNPFIVRFVASSLFAEMIHREKFKSQRSLYEQSGKVFWVNDLELLMTKRFVHQLTLPSGFTGCGFFTLGKSYLIAMCGTILTYEIVLMDMAKTEYRASLDAQ